MSITPDRECKEIAIAPENSLTEITSREDKMGQLALALTQAQAEFDDLILDKEASFPTKSGGRMSYKYASLGACNRVIKKPLAKHGLAITQTINTEGHKTVLKTILVHKSGASVSSQMDLVADNTGSKNSIQAMGSAITYARRYMICAMLNIVGEEDTDAQGSTVSPVGNGRPVQDLEKQSQSIYIEAAKHFWSRDEVKASIRDIFQKDSTKDLTPKEVIALKKAFADYPLGNRTITKNQANLLKDRAEKNLWTPDLIIESLNAWFNTANTLELNRKQYARAYKEFGKAPTKEPWE